MQKTALWAPFGALLGGILLAAPASAEDPRNSVAPLTAPSAALIFVDDDDDDDGIRRRWRKPRVDHHWRDWQDRRGYVLRDRDDDDDDRYRRRLRWRRRDDDDDDDDD